MNEECWFIHGFSVDSFYIGVLKYHSEGSAAIVDFDWQQSLKQKVVGWAHTHPGSKNVTPSSTDEKTMRSWVKATGRSMLCVIRCQKDILAHHFYRNKDGKIWVRTVAPIIIGSLILTPGPFGGSNEYVSS